jgi:hypothetical protein
MDRKHRTCPPRRLGRLLLASCDQPTNRPETRSRQLHQAQTGRGTCLNPTSTAQPVGLLTPSRHMLGDDADVITRFRNDTPILVGPMIDPPSMATFLK